MSTIYTHVTVVCLYKSNKTSTRASITHHTQRSLQADCIEQVHAQESGQLGLQKWMVCLGKVISRPPLGRRFRMLLEPCRSVLDNRRDVKLLYMPREISLTILTLAEAILLVHVDASNLLNRKVVLLNILRKHPSLAKVLDKHQQTQPTALR